MCGGGHVAQQQVHLVDDVELFILVGGDEICHGQDCLDLVQAGELFTVAAGLRRVAGDHDGGPGGQVVICEQLPVRGKRRAVLVVQVERVVVEADAGEQQGGDHCEEGRTAEDFAGVQANQAASLHRARRCAGFERQQGQQRRYHREGDDETDEHAETGDPAEFRDAGVGGRDKGKETDSGADGAQEQGAADIRRGQYQCALGSCFRRNDVRAWYTLDEVFPVAQAVVDGEIDAQADVQHGKGHGNQVQFAHGEGGEGGGQRQARHQADHGDQRQRDGTKAGQQDDRYQAQGEDGGRFGAFHHAQHLFVGQHRGAGQADMRARGRGDAEVVVDLPDFIDRRGSREEPAVIQLRLRQYELAMGGLSLTRTWDPGSARFSPGHQFLPGQAVRPVVAHRFERGIDADQDGVDIYLLAVFQCVERICQHLEQAAQGWVAGQPRQERLDLGEVVGQVLEFVRVQVEQAGFPEQRQGIGVEDEFE